MITIISSTHRTNSKSLQISQYYQKALKEQNIDSQIVDLKEIPTDFLVHGIYETNGKNEVFNVLRDKVQNTEKLIFIVPEYNGSFPGILKLFIDGLTYPHGLKGKTAALCGLSAGPMGGTLALSHLTDILNYLNCNVLAIKPKIAYISNEFVDGEIKNVFIKNLINEQIQQLNKF